MPVPLQAVHRNSLWEDGKSSNPDLLPSDARRQVAGSRFLLG
jgi:hypothetical protein